MKLISYTDLANLRLRDFVGEGVELDLEESGWIILVGLGGFEGIGETRFDWRQGELFQTAGVAVDLGPESLLPPAIADRIIASLGLPIHRGMSVSELIAVFGTPEIDKPGRPGTRWLRFVCGGQEQYLFGCVVDDNRGLMNFFLARKDYCDEDASI